VQVAWADAMSAEFAQHCKACGSHLLNLSYADVQAGKSSSIIASYLRTHPDINHVAFPDGSLLAGFNQVARSAGLRIGQDGVWVTDPNTQALSLQSIMDGSEQMSISSGQVYIGWLIADAMARYSLRMPLTPDADVVYPQFMATKRTVTDATAVYAGPRDYEASFARLWRVSGD